MECNNLPDPSRGYNPFWIIILMLLPFALKAGDNPCASTFLSTTSTNFHQFDNSFNSNSFVDPPPFGNYAGPDTWISFTMPANGELYFILDNGTMLDPAIALYEGACNIPKLLYNVLDNNCDGTVNPTILFDQLTPGVNYYLRIWPQDGTPNGDFSIYLNQSLNEVPGFDAFADAVDLGECIQLTTEAAGQQGCAWYQIPIDFSMPFTHTMTANFGTKDADGADGITLIYQSNGPDFCGGSGQGIGAEGMPNSAIFEFDTWQNPNLNDPFEDHCAFNINGNMNHLFSINGPVLLGNIEDGIDHEIEFSWDPGGNFYELYFDGTLMFSGTFDFINNTFGGENMVYWGYTASTGGFNNDQIICPDFQEFEFGTQEYQEVVICEGENYLGYTESGFYVEFVPGGLGCIHQLNIDLTVNQSSPPTELFETICEGEFIVIDNQTFFDAGFYSIHALNSEQCDSTIYLNLEVITGDVQINPVAPLDCQNTSVTLSTEITAGLDVEVQDIEWFGPINGNTDSLITDMPGTYQVVATFESNGALCTLTDIIVVGTNTDAPQIFNVGEAEINCDSSSLISHLSAEVEDLPNLEFTWTYQDSIVSVTDSVPVLGPGNYILTLTDLSNGCMSRDTGFILLSNEHPTIELFSDTLNCRDSILVLNAEVSNDIISYSWALEDSIFSTENQPEIFDAGLYSVTVTNDLGCQTTSTVEILLDDEIPQAETSFGVIECDADTTSIRLETHFLNEVSWSGPSDFSGIGDHIIVEEEGSYLYTLTNPGNHCTFIDSITIESKGDSPQLSVETDIINCFQKELHLVAEIDQMDAELLWMNENEVIGEGIEVPISEAGSYSILATSSTGCESSISFTIEVDTLVPNLELTADTINCLNNGVDIIADFDSGHLIEWSWPNGVIIGTDILNTTVGGSFLVTVENPENGCSVQHEIEVVDIREFPEFSLVSDTISCDEAEISLGLTLGANVLDINWSGPNNFLSDETSPVIIEGGEYHLQLIGPGNCNIDTSLLIHVDTISPEFTLSFDTITCDNELGHISIELLNEGGEILVLTPEGNALFEEAIVTEVPGQYIIEVHGDNGCISSDSLMMLSFLDLPEVSISQDGIIDCNNESATLVVDQTEALLYEWTHNNEVTDHTQNLTVNEAGNYILEVTNVYGCKNEYIVEVGDSLIYPTIEALGNDIDCDQSEARLHVTSNDEFISSSWNGANGLISNQDETIVNEGGIYWVEVENRHGCTDADSIVVEENTEAPEITTELPGEILILLDGSNRSLPIEVISNSDFVISWTPEIGISCVDCPEPLLLENSGSDYTVHVVNEHGCASELSFKLLYEREVLVTIPNIFTPGNNDGNNDFFTAYGNENVELISTMQIFDRWGQLLYHKEDLLPNEEQLGWDGSYNAERVVPGVYAYRIEILTTEGEILQFVGDITVLH